MASVPVRARVRMALVPLRAWVRVGVGVGVV